MLIYNFGEWVSWNEDWKISFDAENKLMIINSGITSIDVQIDLYSVWKRWIQTYDNAKWAAAFRTFGGDPTSESQNAPSYYFLINGWKVQANDVKVVVQTNLYSEDGLSPFLIDNAAVTNRTSDVPVVKSDIEKRLDYGDRVYYDENSIYAGTTYPNGTIAQPVNNVVDAIAIAELYNIRDFYVLSDINLPGIVGGSFENYSIFADRENLTATVYGNYMNNIDWHGFTIDGNFSGGTNSFTDCVIENALDTSGQFKSCQINGEIRIWDHVVMSACYSGIAGGGAPKYDMNVNRSTSFSNRAYSGGVDLYYANQSGDVSTIELIAGQIIINSSCTDGYVDLRGVGYITDNSSGTTVKTTGFINSFEEYVEETKELDQQLAYQNTLYYDPINGFTGTTYPIGTSAKPSNNIPQLYYLSEYVTKIKTIKVRENFTVSGITSILPPGAKMDYFTITADAPGVNLSMYDEGIAENVKVENFNVIEIHQGGIYNEFFMCNMHEVYGAAGSYANCAIYGAHEDNGIFYDHKFRVQENTTLVSCYPGEAGSGPSIWMTNTGGTELSIRDWNGDITIDKVESENDRIVIEVVAGKVTLTSGCTSGTIDLRGVGYIENNALSGCTVITTGFVDSFQTYIEETRLTDERLAYGDKVYYNETSIYTGTTYPIGTIAQPVNNPIDAIIISGNYNINKFYAESNITLSGITGQLFENYSIVGVKENLVADLDFNHPYHNLFSNMLWENFVIKGLLSGGTNTISDCTVNELESFRGIIKNSKLVGDIIVHGDSDFVNCFSGDDLSTAETREIPHIALSDNGIAVDFRNYSGDLVINDVHHDDDIVTMDINAGKITISSGCTAGYIELRGVGTLIDNSLSGCTVNFEGFVNSFQTYIEETRELDEQLAYGNKIYYDPINGISGITYPVGTAAYPVNNNAHLFYLSNSLNIKTIQVREELIVSGTTDFLPPGQLIDNITFVADSPGIPLYMYDRGIVENVLIDGFKVMLASMGGLENEFINCEIHEMYGMKGKLENCGIFGTHIDSGITYEHKFRVKGNTSLINCYPGEAGSPPVMWMNPSGGTSLSVRGWNGDIILDKVEHVDNTVVIEANAAKITLTSGCTGGIIDLRGVGYIENNAETGCTVITTGFIDSFEQYIEETRLTDEHIAYGGKLYLDGLNGVTGSTYPIGTIAQPVNNLADLLILSDTYNIKSNYIIGSFISQDSSGNTIGIPYDFIGFNNIAVNVGSQLTVKSDDPGVIDISKQSNFYLYNCDFAGNLIEIENCNVENFYNLYGSVVQSSLAGDITIAGDTTASYCYSGKEDNPPKISLVSDSGTTVSFRNWSGFIELSEMSHDDDYISLDVVAARVIIDSGCTSGTIDLRGVGYLVDNSSSGCTVITTGFVDSFQSYIEETRELDEQLAYQNKLFIDQTGGTSGITYPVGTQAQPVDNVLNLFQLSNTLNIKNIHVVTDLTINNLPFVGDNFNTFSDTPKVGLYIDNISGSRLENVGLHDFDIIDCDFAGNSHHFDKCILRSVKNLSGHLINCDLDRGGDIDDPHYPNLTTIEIFGNTTFVNSHPLHAGDAPHILLVNPSGTTCAFRSWNGDLILDLVSQPSDRVIVEMDAGALTISSGCSNGIIEVRGIGEVIDNSVNGCIVKRDGQLQASPGEYDGEIVIDTVNGKTGILYPVGTNSQPVDNLIDALLLLEHYQLSKIRIIGTLTIDDGEDVSGIAFTAERSTGNYLFISSGVTNSTYIENLTTNVTQDGTCRYTTSVVIGVTDFDGGIKNSLLVGAINIVGNGSNYFTDCDTYTTDTEARVPISIGDKKLNMIRCRGFYKITDKTSTNTTTIDLVAGIIEVDSTCVSGVIYIAGIGEVIDNSGSGCTVITQSLSRQSLTDSVWDESITNHQISGSTGNALYNVSAGADPELIAQTVWNTQISGFTEGSAGYALSTILINTSGLTELDTIADDVKRILGLTQENFNIKDHVYDSSDLLQSASISIYSNSADCENDVNPFSTYSMLALYDAGGRLTNYKVTKD